MLNSPLTGTKGYWSVYFNRREIGVYQGIIDPGLNPNVRHCAPKTSIGNPLIYDPKKMPERMTIYTIYLIPLHEKDGSVKSLQVNSLEGLRYLDGFYPTDNAAKDLPK